MSFYLAPEPVQWAPDNVTKVNRSLIPYFLPAWSVGMESY